MKLRLYLLLALAFAAVGCSSVTRLNKFLDKIPATDLAGVDHSFSSPLWSDTIRVEDVSIDADGLLDVGSATADLKIPLWGTTSTTTLRGLKQIPTAKQRAAANAIKAEMAAARAKAAASRAEAKAKAATETAAKTP